MLVNATHARPSHCCNMARWDLCRCGRHRSAPAHLLIWILCAPPCSLNTTPLGSHDGAMVECTSPFSQTADASRSGHSTALQQRRRYPHAAEPPCTAGLPCHPNPASRVAADSTAAAAGSATVAAVQPASHAGVQAQALFPNAVLAALQRQVLQAAAGSASSIQLATQACIQRAQQATPPAPRRQAAAAPALQL